MKKTIIHDKKTIYPVILLALLLLCFQIEKEYGG